MRILLRASGNTHLGRYDEAQELLNHLRRHQKRLNVCIDDTDQFINRIEQDYQNHAQSATNSDLHQLEYLLDDVDLINFVKSTPSQRNRARDVGQKISALISSNDSIVLQVNQDCQRIVRQKVQYGEYSACEAIYNDFLRKIGEISDDPIYTMEIRRLSKITSILQQLSDQELVTGEIEHDLFNLLDILPKIHNRNSSMNKLDIYERMFREFRRTTNFSPAMEIIYSEIQITSHIMWMSLINNKKSPLYHRMHGTIVMLFNLIEQHDYEYFILLDRILEHKSSIDMSHNNIIHESSKINDQKQFFQRYIALCDSIDVSYMFHDIIMKEARFLQSISLSPEYASQSVVIYYRSGIEWLTQLITCISDVRGDTILDIERLHQTYVEQFDHAGKLKSALHRATIESVTRIRERINGKHSVTYQYIETCHRLCNLMRHEDGISLPQELREFFAHVYDDITDKKRNLEDLIRYRFFELFINLNYPNEFDDCLIRLIDLGCVFEVILPDGISLDIREVYVWRRFFYESSYRFDNMLINTPNRLAQQLHQHQKELEDGVQQLQHTYSYIHRIVNSDEYKLLFDAQQISKFAGELSTDRISSMLDNANAKITELNQLTMRLQQLDPRIVSRWALIVDACDSNSTSTSHSSISKTTHISQDDEKRQQLLRYAISTGDIGLIDRIRSEYTQKAATTSVDVVSDHEYQSVEIHRMRLERQSRIELARLIEWWSDAARCVPTMQFTSFSSIVSFTSSCFNYSSLVAPEDLQQLRKIVSESVKRLLRKSYFRDPLPKRFEEPLRRLLSDMERDYR
jgi:hypothetical protein